MLAVPVLEGTETAERAIRTIESPTFLVFAIMDAEAGRLSRFDRQVLGAARRLADAGDGGGAVVAVVAHEAEGLGDAGADRLMLVEAVDAAAAEAQRLAQLVGLHQPRHVLFAENGRGGDLARRLAVKLGLPLLSDVEHLTAKQAVRAIECGRREQGGTPPRLMSLGEDRVPAYDERPCEARVMGIEAPAMGAASAILASEIIAADPATMSLAEADFVVSAGNGVSDFEAFREVAAALGATPGASRVVCDAGLMPRESQVGASGTVLSADCYFALGIAGAPQHLQGIAGCEHVIAVNTDLHAAMVERAGLAIIQDAQKVMPALLRLLKERQR